MRILALDTATEACSAALWNEGELLERGSVPVRGHAELLLPMVEELLAVAGIALGALHAIAFGRGPGAFTGVRIAASTAQALAYGLDLPVVPVSDLQAVALRAARECGASRVIVCLDARMGEVYAGSFALDGDSAPRCLDVERVLAPDRVALPEAGVWFAAGHGFSAHPGLASRLGIGPEQVAAHLLPHAGDIARIAAFALAAGRSVTAEQALPVYLRDDVAVAKPPVRP